MTKLLKDSRAFTLIELLIVIAIISILLAIGAVSYTTVQRNARNDQRKSDLQKIASALEQYYADNRGYPTAIYVGSPGCITSGANCTSGNIYLDPTPRDPRSGAAAYGYSPGSASTNPAFSSLNLYQTYTLTATNEGGSANFTVSSPTH